MPSKNSYSSCPQWLILIGCIRLLTPSPQVRLDPEHAGVKLGAARIQNLRVRTKQ
jgi:hypothetical protein